MVSADWWGADDEGMSALEPNPEPVMPDPEATSETSEGDPVVKVKKARKPKKVDPRGITPVIDTIHPYTTVFTDGSSTGAVGPGGWAWAVEGGPEASGGDHETTNQRMEVYAAMDAVRTLSGLLLVVSDSSYVVNCFNQFWYKGWHKRGWLNSLGNPVANRDLWEPFVELVLARRGEVKFGWIKGHSGNLMNDRVDLLAKAARLALAPPPEL